MADAFYRRSGDDYAEAFGTLLPTGAAWDRDPETALSQLVSGLGQPWGDVDSKALDLLLIETDPRLTFQLLEDWERVFGLPDPCVPVIQSLPERRNALVQKMITQGGQSRAFFIAVAAALGYTITITEFVPWQFGLSSFGGPRGRIYPPAATFYWRIKVGNTRLTRFRFGASSFGRDPLLDIRRSQDLECIFQRWKPAHTQIVFDYTTTTTTVTADRFDTGSSRFGADPILRVVTTTTPS